MWLNKCKCFVRTWHHQVHDEKTDNPLLLVTYRVTLERFVPFSDYVPVYYDEFSRQRVRLASLNDRCLTIVLKKEPLFESLDDSGGEQRKRKLAFFKVERLPQQLTVLTVGVACSTRPEDDEIHLAFRGRLVPWVSDVALSKLRRLGEPGESEIEVYFSARALENSDQCDSDWGCL